MPTYGRTRHGTAVSATKNGSRRGAKSPNPTPSGTHSHHLSSERSTSTLSNATRSRKPRSPRCAMRQDGGGSPCAGRAEVYLIDRDGAEHQVCPAHGAALWLTDPAVRFASDTRPETIAAVLRHAFGGER